MGYTPYYTAAVWTGYDRQERLSSHLGNPSTTLWRQVMSEVHKTLPYKEFAQPDASSLKTVTYCLSSGMLPRLRRPFGDGYVLRRRCAYGNLYLS